MLKRSLLLCAVCLLVASGVSAKPGPKSDAEIKQAIIAESIASYSGNCPCPYNSARNGSKCGKRSAYSKPGGYSPICYESDVTPQMVQEYKGRSR